MATHSSIHAWRIPWIEEPGELWSLGSQRVRHDWSDLAHAHILSKAIYIFNAISIKVSLVQSLSCTLCNPWTAACQISLSFNNSQSLLKIMSIKLVMSSNHLILCRPLLSLPSIFPSIRVFSNELALHIRWPKCWSFSFSNTLSKEYSGLIFFFF